MNEFIDEELYEYLIKHSSEEPEHLKKLNKESINFRLSGNNKYYYANQCNQFKYNLKKLLQKSDKDYDQRLLNRIDNEGISFHPYSINIGYSRYNQHYKNFNSTKELLGFVVGFNNAMEWA